MPEEEARRKGAISRSYVATAAIPSSDITPKLGLGGDRSGLDPINPMPKTTPSPPLEDSFRQRPPAKSILDDDFLTKAPAKTPPKAPERKTDAGTTLPPAPTPVPAAEKKDDGPGGAAQLGAGGQVTPAADTPGVGYLQVTLMLRDFYVIPVDNLPTWIKGLGFLGEPAAQLQYHLAGAAPKTLDAQVLFNLVQASFEVFKRKLDVSIVAGAMANDITHLKLRNLGKTVTPVPGGLDVEYNLLKITPHVKLNLDLQTLFPDQWLQPDQSKPGQRKIVNQSTGEVRLVVEF